MTDAQSGADLPLSGVRVLDLADGCAQMTARLMADLGADVIRAEGRIGGRLRRQEPPVDSESVHHLTHNANKRSIVLDLEDGQQRSAFLRMVDTADIVVTSGTSEALDAIGHDPQSLAARRPHLVVVSVTDFGLTGPYRDWKATDWVHLAMGGVLSRSGLPGRIPLLPPGSLALESAAAQAAWAGLVAYLNRLENGWGDLVDVSIYETTVQAIDPGFNMSSVQGTVPSPADPRDRPDVRHLFPIYPCADGWVRICILSPKQWQGMFTWLGKPAELSDPGLANIAARFVAGQRIAEAITALFATRTRDVIVAESVPLGVPTAGVLSPTEALQVEHHAVRGTFIDVDLTPSRTVRIPAGFFEINGERAGIRTTAPVPGAHTAELLAELELASDDVIAPTTPRRRTRPLAGLRVLDLGVIVLGAEVGRLFADMGAEVIKIESRTAPDGGRQNLTGSAMPPSVAWAHRNKLGLGLNLRDPQGVSLFKELVAKSDVVLANFKPGTLESLGLGYDDLAKLNPGIVLAEGSAFGRNGPWSSRLGYGPLVRATTGLSWLWRYPDDEGSISDAATVYPDHICARIEGFAALAMLIARRRSGRGGSVAVAQTDVIFGQLAAQLARESLQPNSLRAVGNDGPGDAPRGLFPCLGDDEWCVVTIVQSDDWERLTAVLGQPQLARDTRFATPDARVAHRDEVDAVVGSWTSARTPMQAAAELQAAGIAAGMMRRLVDLPSDPHLIARGFFRELSHPLLDTSIPTENTPALFGSIADPLLGPAPVPGEHSREVLQRVLGLGADQLEGLIAAGIVEGPLACGNREV